MVLPTDEHSSVRLASSFRMARVTLPAVILAAAPGQRPWVSVGVHRGCSRSCLV